MNLYIHVRMYAHTHTHTHTHTHRSVDGPGLGELDAGSRVELLRDAARL